MTCTPKQLADAQLKLTKAKTAIVLDHPFFASLLLSKPIEITESVPTASVNARGHIKVSPVFIADKTVAQVVFLLCHEVGHRIMSHCGRVGARNHRKWNIAGDAVINDLLQASKVGEFIDGGVSMPGSKDRLTDAIYNELPDNQGTPWPDPSPPGIGDDIDHSDPMTAEEQQQQDAVTKVEVAQAAQAAKMQGKLSAPLAQFAADLIETRTPWFDILERHMVSFTRADYSWARPNRRFINTGHYLPSTGKTPTMGAVVIQVDVSGSVSAQELAYYSGHMKAIVELCSPETVHVLYTDTQVVKHQEFPRGEDFYLEFRSGGGTDMAAGFTFCEAQGIEPDVFVCLTDGHTPWGEPPGYPVVWCISSDKVADHGETIHFEME
jgi:predicted metal-dependent peptidase